MTGMAAHPGVLAALIGLVALPLLILTRVANSREVPMRKTQAMWICGSVVLESLLAIGVNGVASLALPA